MPKRKWTKEQKDKIVDLYLNEQLTMREISRKFSCRTTFISDIVKERGIKTGRTANRNLNDRFFATIDSELKAYLLGFIMADGSVYYRRLDSKVPQAVLSLELKESDIAIVKLLRESVGSNSALYFNRNMVSIRINSYDMVKDLGKYGVVPNKTYEQKKLVSDLIPKDLIRHYLRGLFDGDGSIWKTKEGHYSMSFTSFFEEGVLDFQEHIDKAINKTNHSKPYKASAWRVTWTGTRQVKKILSYLYNDSEFYLARKHSMALECLRG